MSIIFGRSQKPLTRLEARRVQGAVAPFGVDLNEVQGGLRGYERWYSAAGADEMKAGWLAYRCRQAVEDLGLDFD